MYKKIFSYAFLFISSYILNLILAFIFPPFFPMCDCPYVFAKEISIMIIPIVLSIFSLLFTYDNILKGKSFFTSSKIGISISLGLNVLTSILLMFSLFFY